jgi:hypothetical protein
MPHNPFLAGQDVTADQLQALDDQASYTPVLTATTTDPNLGADGTIEGFDHQNGHHFEGEIRAFFSGTGVAAGSGTYILSLPVDADLSRHVASTSSVGGSIIGGGMILDSGTGARHSVQLQLRAASLVYIQFTGTNSFVQHDNPWTWSSGNRISVRFAYLADPTGLP